MVLKPSFFSCFEIRLHTTKISPPMWDSGFSTFYLWKSTNALRIQCQLHLFTRKPNASLNTPLPYLQFPYSNRDCPPLWTVKKQKNLTPNHKCNPAPRRILTQQRSAPYHEYRTLLHPRSRYWGKLQIHPQPQPIRSLSPPISLKPLTLLITCKLFFQRNRKSLCTQHFDYTGRAHHHRHSLRKRTHNRHNPSRSNRLNRTHHYEK